MGVSRLARRLPTAEMRGTDMPQALPSSYRLIWRASKGKRLGYGMSRLTLPYPPYSEVVVVEEYPAQCRVMS